MNKILIPALLVATVMVAGMFAFAPVEQASTVHTTSGATSIQEFVSATTGDDADDIIVTCPGTSSGCHILEAYVRNTAGANAVIVTIDANIDTITIAGIIDNADTNIASGATALLPELGGFALGPGDTFTLQMTDSTARIQLRIIAEVGNGVALTSGVA